MEETEIVNDYLGRYPVIRIDLSLCKELTLEGLISAMKSIVAKAYIQHPYLETSPHLHQTEKAQYLRYLSKKV